MMQGFEKPSRKQNSIPRARREASPAVTEEGVRLLTEQLVSFKFSKKSGQNGDQP